MKYILLMTGTKEGVDAYKAWSEKDIQTSFAYLTSVRNDLTKSGEFVATEALAMPHQARWCERARTIPPSPTACFQKRRNLCWATGSSTSTLRNELMRLQPASQAALGPGEHN